MVFGAKFMMRRVSMETASHKGKVESSTVYRLARAFRYYEEDPLVRHALAWEEKLELVAHLPNKSGEEADAL